MAEPLPPDVRETAATFARNERAAERNGREKRAGRLAARRDELLAEYGYTSRIRDDDRSQTLVCYPEEWLTDGTVDPSEIDDLSAAVEIPLSGVWAGDPDDWEAVAEHNRRVAELVAERHGPVHGRNARAFATFMSNHRAREIATATPADVEEFRSEYYVRNAWPSAEERDVVEESIALAREVAEDVTG